MDWWPSPWTSQAQVANFDISIDVVERDGGLGCAITYNTDLFDAGTVARMTGQLGVLLAGIAADPGRRVGELPLLGAVERGRVLGEWSGCGAEVPAGSFAGLFEAQAARGA